MREGLSADLGYDRRSRSEQARRVAWTASILADAGVVAIVSLVSPYADDRRAARELHDRKGLSFLEVFVNTPLAECMRRDPRGLYARALAGELLQVTGVSDPYEPPTTPDVEINVNGRDPERIVEEELLVVLEAHQVGSDT